MGHLGLYKGFTFYYWNIEEICETNNSKILVELNAKFTGDRLR